MYAIPNSPETIFVLGKNKREIIKQKKLIQDMIMVDQTNVWFPQSEFIIEDDNYEVKNETRTNTER